MVEEEKKDEKINQLLNDISMMEVYVKDFRNLFSFIPFPICFANPQAIVLEVNPSFTEIINYKESEIIGMKVFDLFTERDQKLIQENLQKGPIRNFEIQIKTKDDDFIPISAFLRKNDETDGPSVGGIFFSFYDLREIKRKEHKLEEKMQEVKKINRLMEGRELKMVELKNKIKKLEDRLKDN